MEWTVQFLQLLHAHEVPGLRTTRTLEALQAARDAELITASDEERLRRAWSMAVRARDAIVLYTGRTSGPKLDVLPSQRQELAGVAHLMGYRDTSPWRLEEEYLRVARHARGVVERIFYGE